MGLRNGGIERKMLRARSLLVLPLLVNSFEGFATAAASDRFEAAGGAAFVGGWAKNV